MTDCVLGMTEGDHPFSKRARQAVPLRDNRGLAGALAPNIRHPRSLIRHPRESGDPWRPSNFLVSHFRGNDGLRVGFPLSRE